MGADRERCRTSGTMTPLRQSPVARRVIACSTPPIFAVTRSGAEPLLFL